jgi:hypothetical protein
MVTKRRVMSLVSGWRTVWSLPIILIGQIGCSACDTGPVGQRETSLRSGTRHDRNEAIAPACDIGNVPSTIQTIAEHFAKNSDMHPEICFLHGDVRPSPRD